MTLTEARRVFDRYKDTPLDDDLKEAIMVAMTVLPNDVMRKNASQRFSEIREGIINSLDGFDPFRNRSRDQYVVFWRHAVFYKMKLEGYSYTEIGAATGYHHTTVLFGSSNISYYLSISFSPIVSICDRLTLILNDLEQSD